MYKLLKRTFDLFFSINAIVFFMPIICTICIANKIFLGSPIFFRQKRIGYKEKTFYILKFRTMEAVSDPTGKELPDERRITKYGQFLRNYSLDELPTLINVIKGDMSLVGPRPLYPEYLDYYTETQKTRHNVKPGITGWAQINGRNALSWDKKLELDTWYVNNKSFLLDFKIVLKTIFKVITASDIHHQDHVSMPRFDDMEKEIRQKRALNNNKEISKARKTEKNE